MAFNIADALGFNNQSENERKIRYASQKSVGKGRIAARKKAGKIPPNCDCTDHNETGNSDDLWNDSWDWE